MEENKASISDACDLQEVNLRVVIWHGGDLWHVVHPRVELSSQIPTICSARCPNRALTPYRDAQRSKTITRDGAGDGLEKSFEHTHFADTNPHIHRSQRASGRKIRPFTATKVPFTATTNATRTALDSSSGGYLLYILDQFADL